MVDKTAQGYFTDFVLQDYRDALKNPLSERHAFHSSVSLNHFIDHYVYREDPEPDDEKVRLLRDSMRKKHRSFWWIDIICNSYKHVKPRGRTFNTVVYKSSAASISTMDTKNALTASGLITGDATQNSIQLAPYEFVSGGSGGVSMEDVWQTTTPLTWPTLQLTFETEQRRSVFVLDAFWDGLQEAAKMVRASGDLFRTDDPQIRISDAEALAAQPQSIPSADC